MDTSAIARRFFEIFASGDLDSLDDLLAPDYRDHAAPPGVPVGPMGIKLMLTPFRAAFPDLNFAIEEQIAAEDKVTTRWTMTGTHRGDLFGISPTGKQVRMGGISIYRIADGRMREAWVARDDLGLLRQLGAAPQ